MASRHILFFDDEPSTTKMLIENLQKNYGWDKDGYGEITFVSTPKELFDEANSLIKYDLFLLDIMVPIEEIERMNLFSKEEVDQMQQGDNTGVVLADKLRSIPKYNDVPFLFLSARIQSSKTMQNTSYLEKPPFASDVSDEMKKLLNI